MRLLIQEENENEGSAFTAVTDEGRPIGFFVYSADYMANSGFLKYIIVDPDLRGQGYGTQMMALILKYAFEISGVACVSLNVFDVNESARRCYRKAGFREEAEEKDAFSYQNELWGRCRMTATDIREVILEAGNQIVILNTITPLFSPKAALGIISF